MNDIISRAVRAAIEDWKNDFKGYVNALNIPRDDYNGIMAYIDEVPSEQPEQRWIPCSKQLPKKSGLYIITQQTPIEEDSVDIIYFNKRNDGGIWSGVRSEKVLAWMERPIPYHPEGKNSERHDQ